MESSTLNTMFVSSPIAINTVNFVSKKQFKSEIEINMPSISAFKFSILPHPPLSSPKLCSSTSPSIFRKFPPCPHFFASPSIYRTPFRCKSAEEEADVAQVEHEWLRKLPEKKKALYSHSLPCVEAWLRSLGFRQSRDDRAVWFVEKADWHAQLSLGVTDLYIRYLKSGAGNLEKEIERRFNYALSREDIENAILGGP